MVARLITIPYSHYCEKARWALDRRGIPFTEERHLPLLHRPSTWRAGGTSTPLLVPDGHPALTDSTDILRFADAAGTTGEPLFPPELPEVATLEDYFDEEFGPHSRRIAYFVLFQDDVALRELIEGSPAPTWEKQVSAPMLPLVKLILRTVLKVDEEEARRSEQRATEVFREVGERLADGRRYLLGDRFTAADLTFAALACPLVLPDSYLRHLMPFDRLPGQFQRLAEQWRSTPAGAFAHALCDAERWPGRARPSSDPVTEGARRLEPQPR